MKKNKYLLFALTLFILFSNKVKASCTEEEVNRFKELESQFKVTHYIENNKYVLKIYNPAPDIFYYEMHSQKPMDCRQIDKNNAECIGDADLTYTVNIKSYNENCTDILKTPEITKYNKYSESELCNGIEDFSLCQPDYEKEITEENFTARIDSYKKNLDKKNQTKDNNSDSDSKNTDETKITLIDNIIEYIQEHLITIIVISIFAILLIITIILKIKSIRKSRYLE